MVRVNHKNVYLATGVCDRPYQWMFSIQVHKSSQCKRDVMWSFTSHRPQHRTVQTPQFYCLLIEGAILLSQFTDAKADCPLNRFSFSVGNSMTKNNSSEKTREEETKIDFFGWNQRLSASNTHNYLHFMAKRRKYFWGLSVLFLSH